MLELIENCADRSRSDRRFFSRIPVAEAIEGALKLARVQRAGRT